MNISQCVLAIAALVGIATLSGCATTAANTAAPTIPATGAQLEQARIRQLGAESVAKSRACRSPLEAKPRYARIYEKLAVRANAYPSPSQLADTEFVTDDDRAVGLDWYAENQECDRAQIELMGRIDPQLAVLAAQAIVDATGILIVAITTQVTYGEVNNRIARMRDSQREATRKWAQSLAQRLQVQHQREVTERQESQRQREVAERQESQRQREVAERQESQRQREAAERQESQRQRETTKSGFWSEVGRVTEAIAKVAIAAVEVLAIQQAAMAQVQQNYRATYPSYRPAAPVTITQCNWIGSTWMCAQR